MKSKKSLINLFRQLKKNAIYKKIAVLIISFQSREEIKQKKITKALV